MGQIKYSTKETSRTIVIRIPRELHDELLKARRKHKQSINSITMIALIKHLSTLRENK